MKYLNHIVCIIALAIILGCSSPYNNLRFDEIGWDYNSRIVYAIDELENTEGETKFIDLKLEGRPFKDQIEAEKSNNLIALKVYHLLLDYSEIEKYIIRTAYKNDDGDVDTLSLEYVQLDEILGPNLKLYDKVTKDLDELVNSGSYDHLLNNLHPSLKANTTALEYYRINMRYNDSIAGKVKRVELETVESGRAQGNHPVLLFKGWASRNTTKQQVEIAVSTDPDNNYYHVINFKKNK